MKRILTAVLAILLLCGCETAQMSDQFPPEKFTVLFGSAVLQDREKAERDFVGREWEIAGTVMRMDKDNAIIKCADDVYLLLYLPEEELHSLQYGSFFTAKGTISQLRTAPYNQNATQALVKPAQIVSDTFQISGKIDMIVNQRVCPYYEGKEYFIIWDQTLFPGYSQFLIYPPEGTTEKYEIGDEITAEGKLSGTRRMGVLLSQNTGASDLELYMDDAVMIE